MRSALGYARASLKEDSYGEESKEGQEGKKSTSQEVIETAPPKAGPDHLRYASCFAPENTMAKVMTKSELIESIAAEQDGMSKKDVKAVLDSLVTVGHKELKKSGAFLLPGFAKFVVIKKPATKEREGINPFTKEPTVFKARPARKLIRARPVKAAKDAV